MAATRVELHDLTRQVQILPCSQRLILAGQLLQQGDSSMSEFAITIADHAVSEWYAIRLLGGKVS